MRDAGMFCLLKDRNKVDMASNLPAFPLKNDQFFPEALILYDELFVTFAPPLREGVTFGSVAHPAFLREGSGFESAKPSF